MSSLGICLKTSHCTGFPSLTEEELKLCQTSVFFFKKYMLHFQSLKFHWIFQKISNWVIKTFLTLRNEIIYIKGSNLYANGYVGNHFLKLHLNFFFKCLQISKVKLWKHLFSPAPQMQKSKNRGSSSTQQQNFAFTISILALAFAAVKIREIWLLPAPLSNWCLSEFIWEKFY